MAAGCQRQDNSFSGSAFSIVTSNTMCSYPGWATWPEYFWPAVNFLPGTFTRNQLLNSSMFVSACHTRARVALSTTLRSIRSVDEFMCNLRAAYYLTPREMQLIGCVFSGFCRPP